MFACPAATTYLRMSDFSPSVDHAGWSPPVDVRRHAPATQRNRQPILQVLSEVLPTSGTVLEIASGTGEHAAWFAQQLRPLIWQPSDPDPEMRRSIAAHRADALCQTLKEPVDIDVHSRPWPIAAADAVVCVNMCHIAPWSATESLIRGAGEHLSAGGVLFIYGPFRRNGVATAPSNEAFDQSLRAQNPAWGLRQVEDLAALAEGEGLQLDRAIEMPANNLSLIFARPSH